MGALIWTATITRPDIACAVRDVARFCENPGLAHRKAVLKGMQYLLHTKKWGITSGEQSCRLSIMVCTDSEFGACMNTRRLVSVAVKILAKGSVSLLPRV